ncbi:radical SAM protein [Dysgonomonas termitidis]|uniref:Radical SAM protein n=1 Tax=Dysgonomonas termitidis TaxID=1516126 RepID=A0ABV9KZE8_9BACT
MNQIFTNKDYKYTLGKEWVLRDDSEYMNKYSALNINTGQILYLNQPLFAFLKIMSTNSLSFNQITEMFRQKDINFDWKHFFDIYKKNNPINLLIPSTIPYQEKYQKYNIDTHGLSAPVASTPFDAEIHLTHKCNLRCLHCFQESDAKSNKFSHLSLEKWLDIFDQFEQMKMFQITISGGEPLYYKYFNELMEEIIKKKLCYNILTNGTLISEKNIQLLSSPNIFLNISLDGHNANLHDSLRGKGTFSRTENAIKKLLNHDAKINISYTVHKENYQHIRDMVIYAVKMNIKSITFSAIDAMGRAELNNRLLLSAKEYKQIKENIENLNLEFGEKIKLSFVNLSEPGSITNLSTDYIYCSAGTRRIAISANGILYPCVYGFGHEELAIGDIKEKSIIDCWVDYEKWANYRGKIKLQNLEKCGGCSLKQKCTLKFCRLKGYEKEKNFLAKPKNCLADRIYQLQ